MAVPTRPTQLVAVNTTVRACSRGRRQAHGRQPAGAWTGIWLGARFHRV